MQLHERICESVRWSVTLILGRQRKDGVIRNSVSFFTQQSRRCRRSSKPPSKPPSKPSSKPPSKPQSPTPTPPRES